MIPVGSMPSELDGNSTYPGGIPGPVIVRAEEALIVILVLLLWAAAIALFFNRWGKIRMLEPYQPKFQQQHRQSCTTIDQNQLQNRRTYSKCNILFDYPPGESTNVTGQTRPRQNSVFTGSSFGFKPSGQMRRTKSALDLKSVVLTENNLDGEREIPKSLRPAGESTKLLQRDQNRRTSVCQYDKSNFRDRGTSICHLDTSPKPWRRERGMSICQFDRMDVLARPLQRERGMSICQFDRMDVLARPLQRDRVGSAYHFDRTEVRPNLSSGKSLLRERRVSVCNILEKDEETKEIRERRSSFGNFYKIDDADGIEKAEREEVSDDKGNRNFYQQDPCCSKNSDVVFGYKATRV